MRHPGQDTLGAGETPELESDPVRGHHLDPSDGQVPRDTVRGRPGSEPEEPRHVEGDR